MYVSQVCHSSHYTWSSVDLLLRPSGGPAQLAGRTFPTCRSPAPSSFMLCGLGPPDDTDTIWAILRAQVPRLPRSRDPVQSARDGRDEGVPTQTLACLAVPLWVVFPPHGLIVAIVIWYHFFKFHYYSYYWRCCGFCCCFRRSNSCCCC